MTDARDGYESDRCLIDKQQAAMVAERQPLEPLLREIRDNFLPGRGRFEGERDTPKDRRVKLANTAPVKAATTLGSGLHSGLTSPARPWVRSSLQDDDLAEWGPVKAWLGIADERMLQLFAKSNLYQALPSMYEEFGSFGTMGALAFEDPVSTFRFEPYTTGSYWLGLSGKGEYDRLSRVTVMTVRQIVDRWGERCLTRRLAQKWARADQREHKVHILHFVEPRGDHWRSCYYDKDDANGTNGGLLFDGMSYRNPILASSWDTVTGETWASSCPGFMAIGAAKALQQDVRDKARAIQKSHNPPTFGPDMDVSLAPGAYNPISADMMAMGNMKIGSVYERNPDVTGLLDNIRAGVAEIREVYFVDLFLMLTLDERNERATAEEIRAKYDEKVLALGPTLERANSMLRGLHTFAFDVMVRRSLPIWEGRMDGTPLLPEPPQELRDGGIEIVPEFISALQMAQRAQRLQGIERFAAFAGQMAQLTGGAPEKFNIDQALDEYGAGLGVPAGIINDDETVDGMRQAVAQKQQMQQMAAMAPAMAQGADAMAKLGTTAPVDNNMLGALAGSLASGGAGSGPV